MIKKIFDRTITVEDIAYKSPESGSVEESRMANDTGRDPVVWYNGYQIDYKDIDVLTIDNNSFIPTLYLSFTDGSNIIKDRGFPLDDTVISIFIKSSKPDTLMPVRMDFKITSFKPNVSVKKESTVISYTLKGLLNVDTLFLQKQRSFKQLTSFKVFETISKEAGLGFMSNIEDSNDKMNWINIGNNLIQWLQEVNSMAYISEESFTHTYIDMYYNLNFIDVEVQLRESADNSIGVVNHGGYNKALQRDIPKENKEPEKLALTNVKSANSSESYFSDYKIDFNSFEVSFVNGYRRNIYLYDVRGNWSGRAGKFNTFVLDSITTPGVENEAIILKGSPKNPDFYKNHETLEWVGKLDIDNMHANLTYAKSQNSYNHDAINKLSCTLTLPNPNFNLYRYQKITVNFSDSNSTPSAENSTESSTYFNKSLSGEWLIIGISFKYSAKGGKHQIVTLVKRELEAYKSKEN
jgi:hypothetical protein